MRHLFKFTDKLQQSLDKLFDKQKGEIRISEEAAQLAGILELNQIFTLTKIINETSPNLFMKNP